MLATTITILALGAAALCSWWAFLFVAQRSVLFPAPQPASRSGEIERLGGQRIWLALAGGGCEAWFLPARREGPSPLLLFAHGNGEVIDDWPLEFEQPRTWGVSVLLLEYPGYGRSAGSPSQASITEATLAAYDWASAEPRIDRGRIVGYGRSLGGGAICALSRQRPLAALVLESTFTSVRSMASRFWLPGFLVRDPFDNLGAVGDFAGPILLLHGERDDLIPPENARALAAAASQAELHLLRCAHNDCPRPWPILERFLGGQGLL